MNDKKEDWFKKVTENASKAAKDLSEKCQEYPLQEKLNDVKKTVNETAKKTKNIWDESEISDKAAYLSSATSDQMDTISGKKIMEELETQTAQQEVYNNILATKLEEALLRIQRLEDQQSSLTPL